MQMSYFQFILGFGEALRKGEEWNYFDMSVCNPGFLCKFAVEKK